MECTDSSPVTSPSNLTGSLFLHQVGGHSACASVDEGRIIAKGVKGREVDFYVHVGAVAPGILPYLPKYYGVVNVTLDSKTIEALSAREVHDANTSAGYRLFKAELVGGPVQRPSILLENLLIRYRHPCILDLKLGTRTYKDGATPAKILSAVTKVNATTSRTLGLRVCGMQLYDPSVNEYVREDKYLGRKYDDAGARDAIQRFLAFNNTSNQQLSHFKDAFLGKIDDLSRRVTEMLGVRLYASSLLLIREGDPDGDILLDIKMIDFANASIYKDGEPDATTPDDGYLLGLRNLREILQAM